MRSRNAVLLEAPAPGVRGKLEIIDIEVDEPRFGEILVKMTAAGLCHSDDHLISGSMIASRYPLCLGHEGAGVVVKVGPESVDFEVGDHVVFSFLPVCGRCRWCATGQQNLCDRGRYTMSGSRPDDPYSFRLQSSDGVGVGQMAGLGAFAEYTTVHVTSAIKVDRDLPLDKLCLLGCAVGTGWGAAINSAAVRPGDVVIVMGVGGVGINAVQGAAFAGAAQVIAVDPVAFKRDIALALGATHACADIAEAEQLARSATNGQGADSAIVTVGLLTGEHVAAAFRATRKGGSTVVTAIGSTTDIGVPISLIELTLSQKRLQGSLFGATNPTFDIPRQTELYRAGLLHLDELVTATYPLDAIEQGYADMHAGKTIRGVVTFE
jgi:NDMA-dependent alcohol dehydrogenase